MEAVGIAFENMFGGAYFNKRVLVTGHTGFKGAWLTLWLTLMGAEVMGYALDPPYENGVFGLCGVANGILDVRNDIRDGAELGGAFWFFQPEIVFHLAAQPIVRLSYDAPLETLETNVMGTVNVLENIRRLDSVRAAVIVTSDKCYENREQLWGYRECDAMGGFDPYSASKGCAELISSAYERSFFEKQSKGVATARAGNVIGGGDWAKDRILPDCIRALKAGKPVGVRNPRAVRPWQFALEPLYGYLLLGQKLLYDPKKYSGPWNFGPDDAAPVGRLVETLIGLWGCGAWEDLSAPGAVHEAAQLHLDCAKARALLGWRPRLSLYEALAETAAWYRAEPAGDLRALCIDQIARYYARANAALDHEERP